MLAALSLAIITMGYEVIQERCPSADLKTAIGTYASVTGGTLNIFPWKGRSKCASRECLGLGATALWDCSSETSDCVALGPSIVFSVDQAKIDAEQPYRIGRYENVPVCQRRQPSVPSRCQFAVITYREEGAPPNRAPFGGFFVYEAGYGVTGFGIPRTDGLPDSPVRYQFWDFVSGVRLLEPDWKTSGKWCPERVSPDSLPGPD